MAGDSARDRAERARAKSERLARYAEQWAKGADGESQTAAELGRLGEGWVCWHDLKWPGRRLANIDHIAIGPGGVFVIDSKNWSGMVSVKDGVLRQNGYRRESAVAGCADSAIAVGELFPEYLNAVKPVLCFVRDEPVVGRSRDVMLCSTANLVEMLTSRPRLVSEVEVADVAARLSSKVAPMTDGSASVSSRRPVARRVSTSASSPTEQLSPTVGHKRLPRFLVGLGIWFCFMVVTGAVLSAFPAYSDSLITPAAFIAGVASWIMARRILR